MASTSKIYVAIVGVGLVGAELVNQILSLPAHNSPFRIISLCSSSRSLFFHPSSSTTTSPSTLLLRPSSWRSLLDASTEKPNLIALADKLGAIRSGSESSTMPKIAVVDNTASDLVASFHPLWLQNGLNVVTPNKKAASADLDLYWSILSATKGDFGSRYLYEATVGAGLPVISTLKDLVATGDEVLKIEGVFSGTMSYIFNEFSTTTGASDGPSFSSIVSLARQKGYTEPHPGEDLKGSDVARKLTILSRIISFNSISSSTLPDLQSGFESVQTTSLVPPELDNVPSGDEFVARLKEFDGRFARIREEAAVEGKVLRYVGVIDVQKGVVSAGLERYPATHPFASSLGGADNIVMFHTKRYGDRPLIVQGAGAGAEVTAMGVLSDLFKLV